MPRIEVILDGKDHTEKAFATFRNRIKGTIGELKTGRKSVTSFSTDVKASSQSIAKSAPEYVKMQKHLRAYDKSLTRLTSQIPKTTAQQNSWKAAMTRSVNAMKPYIKNFGEVSPLYGKVAKDAVGFNNSLIQSTGFVKKGGKYIETFSGKMKRLGNSFADCSGPLYKWGRIFNHYLPIVFVGIYAFKSLQKSIGELTKVFSDFESELITVERTTGMAHTTVTRLGDIFLELASITPATIADFEKIAVTAGRLGITGEANIMKFTEAVIKMANATILTADQASDSLARVSNAMGLPIENVLYLGSMIDTLANTSAANAEQIVTVMKRAAGAAKVMDIPAEALAAMGATLVESGEESARAGTRLGRAFVYAATHITSMARQMGMSVEELREQMEVDMLEVWKRYLKMLKDTPSKIDRIAKAHEVFGMIGTKAVTKLANNYEKFIGHLKDAHSDMLYGITLEREYAKTLETTAAKLQMVDNEIEALKIRIGEKLVPVMLLMKNITKGFYETLAGPEPIEYGNRIGYITEEVEALLSKDKELITTSDEYNSILGAQVNYMDNLLPYRKAYKESLGLETGLLAELKREMSGEVTERERAIESLHIEMNAIKTTYGEWLRRADIVSDGAMTEIFFANSINQGMKALAKYGLVARRANAMTASLTKSMIEEGIASDELIDIWDELGDEIENNRKLIKDLVTVQTKWGDITEWLADIQGELGDAMTNHLKIVNDVIDAEKNLSTAQWKAGDALAYLSGEYPTFLSLTGGSLANIKGMIVPMSLLEMGIINLGDVIPKHLMNPLQELIGLHSNVINSFNALNTAKKKDGVTDEELSLLTKNLRKDTAAYTIALGNNAPAIAELNTLEHESGLIACDRLQTLKDMAILTDEELEFYLKAPSAIENFINSQTRLAKIQDEIKNIMTDSAGATKIWEDAQIGAVTVSDAIATSIKAIGDVTDKEREKLLEEAMAIVKNTKSKDELNEAMINWITLVKRSKMTEDELAKSDERLNKLREEHRDLTLQNLKPMVDYNYITGKTADDLGLLISAAGQLKDISIEEGEAMNDLALATLWMGKESGDVEGKIDELDKSLTGFGLAARFIPDELDTMADESGMIIEDMMGNILVDTQKAGKGITELLGGVSEDQKKAMEGAGLYWTGIFGKALLAEVAMTGTVPQVLSHSLMELGKIAFNTDLMSKILAKEAGVKIPEATPVLKVEGMQFGGKVEKTSLFKLHKGEEVLRKGETKGSTMSISIGNVNLSPDYPAQRFLEDLEKYRFSIT